MASGKKPITIDDLWAMRRIGSPSVSPDGQWTCIAVTRHDMEHNSARSQLWLVSSDGKTQRQLTQGRHDADPQWSPDGKWIAFIGKRGLGEAKSDREAAQVYVISPDGGEARELTSLATGAQGLRWFPDSKRIAFISWVWPELESEKQQNQRHAREKKDKLKAIVVERNNYMHWDHWFPRDRDAHLFVADLATGKSRDLFAGTTFSLPPYEPSAELYDIAPDGKEIAFTFDFNPDPLLPSRTEIVLLEVKSKRWSCPTEQSGRSDQQPRYSPDGKRIAYLTSDVARLYNDQARIAVIERASGRLRALTYQWDRGVNAPLTWSADSKSLYFSAESEERQTVWRLHLSDRTPVEIIRGPDTGGCASGIAISSDGTTLVYLRGSISHPPQLYAASSDGSNERQIEQFNRALLARLALTKPESVSIKGVHGEPVQMWIIKPPRFDPKKKWPLMQTIHGGPHACFNDTWHWRWNAQLFAAAGYVVAQVNYHGSTGWGQKFVSSINGDWGWREMADVEAGTDYLLKTGWVDEKRMVATGGSYGGYMVAYMNGNIKPGRYQAYVCHAGCYDWVAMMASDGYGWLGRELGAFAWQDEARVLKQSPHHFAHKFATPTLVVHGELDYRVPYHQGLAYYNTLRARGIPSRLVYFPDENHWILKPQNSRLWYKEYIAWCDRHTPGKAARKTGRH